MQVKFPGEQSTVPEVATTVPVFDDPALPSLTFRFWVSSTIFGIFAAAVACLHGQDSSRLAHRLPLANVGWCAGLLLIITTQCVRYGFGGLCRNWLVKPAAMWYPGNVVLVNVLHVFHAKVNDGIIGERVRLFNKLCGWVIIYEFLPQYFATYLVHFNIVCMAFGSLQGRLGSITDYPLENPDAFPNVPKLWPLTSARRPMAASGRLGAGARSSSPSERSSTPFFPCSLGLGSALRGCTARTCAAPTCSLWRPTGTSTSMVLNNVTLVVEDDLYENYSPLRLSTFWALSYGTSFDVITSLLSTLPSSTARRFWTVSAPPARRFMFGLAVPGKAIANVCFKTYGYTALAQALDLITDLKFAVYMTIANHQPGPHFDPDWGSTNFKIFYTASLIWGAVGPKRMFGPDSSFAAISFRSRATTSTAATPTSDGTTSTGPSSSSTGVAVPSTVPRYHPTWFDKYNYIISAALDSGTIVTAIILYLTVTTAKLDGGSGQAQVDYVFWALNPNSTKYADQDYCLNYTPVGSPSVVLVAPVPDRKGTEYGDRKSRSVMKREEGHKRSVRKRVIISDLRKHVITLHGGKG
ncbi:hypothetical protein BDK51DRAFT_46547 [Blyttiomyces helicus]|uniref:OPT oligopeptide transporter protein-domain-containing protein n=1 Tax=Blyttiomyces helicus TaxID=388810 RepID=A0A4P9WS39_9FUNG|nr:hypothetical protein BDK51DRAFT_46547 [Blyttiomyces helicus]|eukprot:RKO93786.1 hypothetical protein BDK51DRAFT_46547 [Blyttiomyces helicus]